MIAPSGWASQSASPVTSAAGRRAAEPAVSRIPGKRESLSHSSPKQSNRIRMIFPFRSSVGHRNRCAASGPSVFRRDRPPVGGAAGADLQISDVIIYSSVRLSILFCSSDRDRRERMRAQVAAMQLFTHSRLCREFLRATNPARPRRATESGLQRNGSGVGPRGIGIAAQIWSKKVGPHRPRRPKAQPLSARVTNRDQA